MLLIKRVLNNNAVVATDKHKQTLVALGNGIAFHKKAGEIISEDKVEKIFYPQNEKDTNSMSEMLASIDPKYIELSDQIISETIASSGKKLSDDIYLSLPDHLQFAVERLKKGMPIQNRLTIETMQTYPDEFQLGKRVLRYLEKTENLKFPEDEHTAGTIELINRFLEIISEMLKMEINSKSVAYYRLVTHLKFFAQKISKKQTQEANVDPELYNMVIHRYHKEYLISQRIAGIVMQKFNYKVSQDEIMYLTIHIHHIAVADR